MADLLMIVRRRIAPVLLTLILPLSVSCGVAVDEPSVTVVPTDTPAPLATPTPDTALLDRGGVAIIERAYDRLLDDYIDPLEPSRILDGAWTLLATEAGEQGIDVPLKPEFVDDRSGDFALFEQAYVTMAAESPDATALRYASIRGMTQALQDCHTFFLSPVASDTLNDAREGIGVVGIGVELTGVPAMVTEVITSGPADRAGILAGDRIVEINGEDARGFGVASAQERINGEEGTEVAIVLERPGSDVPVTATLRRERVNPPNVEARVIDGAVGYIRIRNFVDGGVSADLRRKIDEFEAQGVGGWILDIRGNPGGRLDVPSMSLFVPSGVVVRARDRNGTITEEVAGGGALAVKRPIALLTNNRTGSVAEVFAAALQEHGVAYVVGGNTNGCVGYTDVQDLGDGSSLAVTSHVNLGPVTGNLLTGVGVAPDEAVARTEADIASLRDPQLDAAVSYLESNLGMAP